MVQNKWHSQYVKECGRLESYLTLAGETHGLLMCNYLHSPTYSGSHEYTVQRWRLQTDKTQRGPPYAFREYR
jgi:hypothetical protein